MALILELALGQVRNVTIKDSKLDGTNLAVRIKTMCVLNFNTGHAQIIINLIA